MFYTAHVNMSTLPYIQCFNGYISQQSTLMLLTVQTENPCIFDACK